MCGACAHSRGEPSKANSLANGRSKNYVDLSTGPKTAEGLRVIGETAREGE